MFYKYLQEILSSSDTETVLQRPGEDVDQRGEGGGAAQRVARVTQFHLQGLAAGGGVGVRVAAPALPPATRHTRSPVTLL